MATDGWYALLTCLPVDIDASEILIRYKGQEVVERRYDVLEEQPAYQGPDCLVLLTFRLIERQVRLAIAPTLAVDGLYVGRPAKPTGRLIFEALGRLRMIPAHCPRWPDPTTMIK